MSKQKTRQQPKPNQPDSQSRSRRKAAVAIGLILCLGVTGVILAQWRASRAVTRASATLMVAPPTPSFSPNSPSKEYIYAGGRLIATEEPVSTPTPPPPPPPPPPGPTTDYNAVNDFSATNNPSGVWSYGYRTPDGTFALMPSHDNIFGLPAGMNTWYLPNAYNLPAIIKNGTGVAQSYYGATHPPPLLNLYPGTSQQSVLRWTAPTAGTVTITGRFEGLDATTTNVAVTYNSNTSLLSGNVTGLGNQVPFTLTRTVAAGDTVEFAVGNGNGDLNHDSTGLAATVSLQAAAPAVTTYKAVNDFSATQNPNGRWSYGWLSSGGAFTLFVKREDIFGLGAGMHTWYVVNAYNLPAVIHNGTGANRSYFGATQPPTLLNLYPGAFGEKSVVRWTASQVGTVQIGGRFEGLDAATTDVSVVQNGVTTLMSGSINGFGQQAPFTLSRTVSVGDTIDFRVGYGNGNVSHDSTGLSVTITR